MKVIPNYHPPSDYRRPTKTQEKVYVPVNDYPEINFSMITNPLTVPAILSLISFTFSTILLEQSPMRHRNEDNVFGVVSALDRSKLTFFISDIHFMHLTMART
jgi:hypothetical protein